MVVKGEVIGIPLLLCSCKTHSLSGEWVFFFCLVERYIRWVCVQFLLEIAQSLDVDVPFTSHALNEWLAEGGAIHKSPEQKRHTALPISPFLCL